MIFRSVIGIYFFIKLQYLMGNKRYLRAQIPILILNFIVQRVFGINNKMDFQVNYNSTVEGVDSKLVSESFKFCCAVNGGVNIVIAKGTKLEVGEDTIFAKNICIRTANHEFLDRKKYIKADVSIGKNCWIGHGAVILPGVKLGDNITVGANSVVTKSFGDNVVIAGVPAKIIKNISND